MRNNKTKKPIQSKPMLGSYFITPPYPKELPTKKKKKKKIRGTKGKWKEGYRNTSIILLTMTIQNNNKIQHKRSTNNRWGLHYKQITNFKLKWCRQLPSRNISVPHWCEPGRRWRLVLLQPLLKTGLKSLCQEP